ncbi:hypothetical protein FRC11_007414 [Ceratobasidium sp. 423]|nr:hypothetical protein FRC11_007414 [Ceratobasidium sp. 423]
MSPKNCPSETISQWERRSIKDQRYQFDTSIANMGCSETYVSSSDEEQPSRMQKSSGAKQSKASGTKRPCSKSPAPTQAKKPKMTSKPGTTTHRPSPANSQKKAMASKKKSKAQKPTVASLTIEERTAKNAASRLSTIEQRRAAPPKEELAACIEHIKESGSPAYTTFEFPKLLKPLVKGTPYKYYIFVCKVCGEKLKQLIGVMDTSSLLKHQDKCELRRLKQGTLGQYGITGGRQPPTKYEVREYVVLWITEDGRPFAIIEDRYLIKLLPVEISDMLPARSTITKDIGTMYRMSQKVIKTMLSKIPGVFHIALDMYQSGNGLDYLGLVLFHAAVKENSMYIERFVLECLSFTGQHMGVALANVVYGILRKFDIQDRVLGVVCDNASNNADMMNRFKKFKMKRLVGPTVQVHCLPHVLNLASKAIAAPFTKMRTEMENASDPRGANKSHGGLSDSEDEEAEDHDNGNGGNDGDAYRDDESIPELLDPNAEDETGEDDGTAPSHALDPEEEDEDPEDIADVFLPEIITGSRAATELKQAVKGLYKFAWWARKLQFSPQFKAEFQAICADVDAETPHNIQHDVRTHWNSTRMMITDAVRLESAM